MKLANTLLNSSILQNDNLKLVDIISLHHIRLVRTSQTLFLMSCFYLFLVLHFSYLERKVRFVSVLVYLENVLARSVTGPSVKIAYYSL